MASDREMALPGFQEFLERDVDRAGAVDFRKKDYNAIRIRADYPGTYESVARALFFYKLPVKTCADLFKMNSLCVAAIRDQVIAESATSSAASFLVNSRRRSQREIVLTRIVEAIAEKLDDVEIVKKMSIAELTDILNRLDKAPPARNGTDEPPKAKVSDGEIIDIEAYDQALAEVSGNRLDSAKKTARTAPEPSTEDAGNCSTGNSLKHCLSVSLSDNSVKTLNVQRDLCKSLCKKSNEPWKSGSDSDGESRALASDASADPGAGGCPGARADGGVNINASDKQTS